MANSDNIVNPFLDEDDDDDPEVILSRQISQRQSSPPLQTPWQDETPDLNVQQDESWGEPSDTQLELEDYRPPDDMPLGKSFGRMKTEEPGADFSDDFPGGDDFNVDEFDRLLAQAGELQNSEDSHWEREDTKEPLSSDTPAQAGGSEEIVAPDQSWSSPDSTDVSESPTSWDNKTDEAANLERSSPDLMAELEHGYGDIPNSEDEEGQVYDFGSDSVHEKRGWRGIVDQIKSEFNPTDKDSETEEKSPMPSDISNSKTTKSKEGNLYTRVTDRIAGFLFKIKPLRRFEKAVKITTLGLPVVLILLILLALFGGSSGVAPQSSAGASKQSPNAQSLPSQHPKFVLPSGGASTLTGLDYNTKTDMVTGVLTNTGSVILHVIPSFRVGSTSKKCVGGETLIPIGQKVDFSVPCSANYTQLQEDFQWIQ